MIGFAEEILNLEAPVVAPCPFVDVSLKWVPIFRLEIETCIVKHRDTPEQDSMQCNCCRLRVHRTWKKTVSYVMSMSLRRARGSYFVAFLCSDMFQYSCLPVYLVRLATRRTSCMCFSVQTRLRFPPTLFSRGPFFPTKTSKIEGLLRSLQRNK